MKPSKKTPNAPCLHAGGLKHQKGSHSPDKVSKKQETNSKKKEVFDGGETRSSKRWQKKWRKRGKEGLGIKNIHTNTS